MSTPRLYNLIRVTPGGRHGWYDSSLGFPLKKPLGQMISERTAEIEPQTAPRTSKLTLWQRFLAWLRSF